MTIVLVTLNYVPALRNVNKSEYFWFYICNSFNGDCTVPFRLENYVVI